MGGDRTEELSLGETIPLVLPGFEDEELPWRIETGRSVSALGGRLEGDGFAMGLGGNRRSGGAVPGEARFEGVLEEGGIAFEEGCSQIGFVSPVGAGLSDERGGLRGWEGEVAP